MRELSSPSNVDLIGVCYAGRRILNSAGNTLELITGGVDGGVRHSRFIGGAWSSTVPLNAVTFLPPTLAAQGYLVFREEAGRISFSRSSAHPVGEGGKR
jgi:hypothetical protein